MHLLISTSRADINYLTPLKEELPNSEIVKVWLEGNLIEKTKNMFDRVDFKDGIESVIFLGDRMEILPPALEALFKRIPIVHLQGGDITYGVVDNEIRYAMTKLAHIHLPATEKAKRRIINTGEEEWRIRVVGSMSLNYIDQIKDKLKRRINEEYAVVLYHRIPNEKVDIERILNELESVGIKPVIIVGNTDYYKQEGRITFNNLPAIEYYSLLKYARVMIGNSSSGIIEAPHLGTPVINIGIRQDSRDRPEGGLIDISPEEAKNIIDYLDRIPKFKRTPYYKKDGAKLAAEFIEENIKKEDILLKRIQ